MIVPMMTVSGTYTPLFKKIVATHCAFPRCFVRLDQLGLFLELFNHVGYNFLDLFHPFLRGPIAP